MHTPAEAGQRKVDRVAPQVAIDSPIGRPSGVPSFAKTLGVRGKSWHSVQEASGRPEEWEGDFVLSFLLPGRILRKSLPQTRSSYIFTPENHARHALQKIYIFASPWPLVTLSRGLPNLRLHLYPSRSQPSHRLPMQQEKMSSQNNLQDSAAPRPAEAQPAVNSTPMPSTSGSDDTLLCKWKQCGERADTAESLFVSLVPPSPPKSHSLMYHPGPPVREAYRTKEHQQPEPRLWLGGMQHQHCQARSHHLPRPGPRPPQATQVWLLWQGFQAAPGLEEARQGRSPAGP